MHVKLVIVICIIFILGMVVEANMNQLVHPEYLRRRWAHDQSVAFKMHHEPPAGVHAEYRRRWMQGQYASAVKTPHELPAREHRRHPRPRV